MYVLIRKCLLYEIPCVGQKMHLQIAFAIHINFYGFEFNSTYFFGGHSNLVIFVEFVGKICLKTTFNKTLFCNVPYLSPPSSIFVSNYVSNCKRYLHETQMNVLLTVTIRYNTRVLFSREASTYILPLTRKMVQNICY